MSTGEPEVRYWGIVPAAGLGERMAAAVPKQYLEIAGEPILTHTLRRMLGWEILRGLVVALHAGDEWWSQQQFAGDDRVTTVIGGEQRCHSVLAALQALQGQAATDDWVLVHDAVRPCISSEDVENLRAGLVEDSVGGILAVPVTETVKRADARGRVERTLERSGLWLAQTPQMFRYGVLVDCLQAALEKGFLATDEAAAIEQDRDETSIKLRFPKEFVGKNEKGHNERKTKKRMMWIPHWLLKEFKNE